MNWWAAIWAAVAAFFSALKKVEPPAPEEVDEVADETDDQLRADAESLGLVQPKGPDRPE